MTSQTMKLYVTGITGHTGRFFIQRMMEEHEQSIDLVCIVRDSSDTQYLDQSNLNYTKVYGDLNDVQLMTETMAGCDMVLHIASIYMSNNVVEAVIAAGVPSAILVHTTGRFSKYKSASEEYIQIEDKLLDKREQIAMTILRPTMIYGTSRDRNMVKLIQFIKKYPAFPVFGKGMNLMQPVHAKDLGDAYYDVIQHWDVTCNQEYNLSGGKALPYIDVINLVAKYLGKRIMKLRIPIGLSIFAAKVYNKLFKNAIITVEQVMRMMEDKDFDYSKAAQDFGYAPMDFDKGIQMEIMDVFGQTFEK